MNTIGTFPFSLYSVQLVYDRAGTAVPSSDARTRTSEPIAMRWPITDVQSWTRPFRTTSQSIFLQQTSLRTLTVRNAIDISLRRTKFPPFEIESISSGGNMNGSSNHRGKIIASYRTCNTRKTVTLYAIFHTWTRVFNTNGEDFMIVYVVGPILLFKLIFTKHWFSLLYKLFFHSSFQNINTFEKGNVSTTCLLSAVSGKTRKLVDEFMWIFKTATTSDHEQPIRILKVIGVFYYVKHALWTFTG